MLGLGCSLKSDTQDLVFVFSPLKPFTNVTCLSAFLVNVFFPHETSSEIYYVNYFNQQAASGRLWMLEEFQFIAKHQGGGAQCQRFFLITGRSGEKTFM